MKILLTNYQLYRFTGTEVFTYTLAKELKKRGHDVTVYSAYSVGLQELFADIDIPVYSDIYQITDEFDIAHVHHNINAFEVRNRFPELPMVFMSHGVTPNLEQPPLMDIGISKYLAISEEVKENLIECGIHDEEIDILRNLIDESNFYPHHPISPYAKKALVISNYIDPVTEETIRAACLQLGIETTFVGIRFKTVPNNELPILINQHDLVFSLSRGIMEAMFCARIPIVVDKKVGDGMVTPDNFSELITRNFSGRVHWKVFTVEELVQEIKKYDARNGEVLRRLAMGEFSKQSQADRLVEIYEQVVADGVPDYNKTQKNMISFICCSVQSARNSTRRLVINEVGGDGVVDLAKKFNYFRLKVLPRGSKRENFMRSVFLRRNKTKRN